MPADGATLSDRGTEVRHPVERAGIGSVVLADQIALQAVRMAEARVVVAGVVAIAGAEMDLSPTEVRRLFATARELDPANTRIAHNAEVFDQRAAGEDVTWLRLSEGDVGEQGHREWVAARLPSAA